MVCNGYDLHCRLSRAIDDVVGEARDHQSPGSPALRTDVGVCQDVVQDDLDRVPKRLP
jgi:hypothetical protein